MSAAPILAKTFKYEITILGSGEKFTFTKPKITIGRNSDNDIVLVDPKVSREHLEVRIDNGHIKVKNISGKNFVAIGNNKIEEEVLTKNTIVKIGETELEIKPLFDQPSAAPKLSVVSTGAKSQISQAAKELFNLEDSTPTLTNNKVVPSPATAPSMPRPQVMQEQDKGKIIFYLVFAVIIVSVVWFLFSSSVKNKKDGIRRQKDIIQDIEKSVEVVQDIETKKDNAGQTGVLYKSAQEQYIKGFRDYRLGQYSRAMQSFQAALSFYPNHELARQYWTLSKRKFDELVQYNMMQGRRYLGKENYKYCKASFSDVMNMLKDPSDGVYKEAKQYYDECSVKLEGKY